MTVLAESGATLVVSGPELVPDDVTCLIGGSPRRAEQRGKPVLLPGGGRRLAETGLWELRATPRKPADLDAQIAELFAGLSADPGAWATLAAQHSVELCVSLYLDTPNEATALTAETIALLAERKIALRLEILAPYTPAASCGG